MAKIYIKGIKDPLQVEYDKAKKLKDFWQGDDFAKITKKEPNEIFAIGEYTGEFGSIRAIFLSDENKKHSAPVYGELSSAELFTMHRFWKEQKQYRDEKGNWITKEIQYLVLKSIAVLDPNESSGFRVRFGSDWSKVKDEWDQYEKYCVRIEFGLKKRLEEYQK